MVNNFELIKSMFYFNEAFPDVDVHKNSMGTMLYYPNNLDKPTYCCSQCGGTNIMGKC